MGDVFISYSRKDTEFVHNLDTALTEHSHNVWVDWKEIRGGSEWWEEIIAGIEGADKFIFVISPDSIDSEYCGKEIEYAVSQNKKILPILWRSGLGSKGIPLRSEVSSHHYISFEARDDFDQAIQELNEAINLDIDLFHAHKRLLVKAIEWGNGRSDSLLLRRDDLANAEQWLAASVSQAPKPTELQETYIKNSRVVEDASDQAKAILEKAAADAQITATVAENARKESEKKAADAQRAATDAENARKESEKKAADAQSAATGAENALKEAKKKTDLQIKIGSGILAGTILLAVVAGVSATKFVNEANVKVDETERDANEKKKIADLAVRSAQKKADDIKKVSEKDARDAEQKVNGANAKKKDAEMKVEEAQKNLESAKAEAEKVSKESQEQVAAAQAKIADALTRVKSSQLELKILNDGLNVAKLINSQSPQNGDLVRAVLLSIESVIDSRSIQSKQIKDQAIKTLTETLEQSREINIFRGQDEKPVYFVAPTSDRDMNIFAIVYNKPKKLLEFQVWDANGSVISSNSKPLGIATYLGKLVVSTFTRNNKAILIIGDSKGIIKLQDIQDNYILGLKPSGTTSSATSIATSKDGSVIAAAYGDPYIRIWRSDIWITNQQDKFSENISFLDEEDLKVNPMCSVNLVAIDSKGETIVSVIKQVQEGEILKIWKLNKGNAKYDESNDFLAQTITSTALAISPNGETVVNGTQQGGIFIFKVGHSDSVKSKNFHSQQIRSIIFLNDFSFVTSSDDGIMGLWTITPEMEIPPIKLRGHSSSVGIDTVSSNLNGTILSGSRDGTVRLWDIKPISNMNSLSDNDDIMKFACLRIKDHPVFRESEKNDSICEKILSK